MLPMKSRSASQPQKVLSILSGESFYLHKVAASANDTSEDPVTPLLIAHARVGCVLLIM